MSATEPEFLQYSPDDIVTMGREQGLPPGEIAQGVMNHRKTLETWGRDNGGDQYFNGAVKLDNDTEMALGGLRLEMQQQELRRAIPDPMEQQKLAAELEKHAYDVSKLPDAFRPVVEKTMKVGQELSLPRERYYGAKVTAGGKDLANFSMRRAEDGMMDVGLTIPDPSDPMKESQALVRVPHATAEDVQKEIVKRKAALQEVERARKGQGYAPDTPDVDTRSMAYRFYADKAAGLQQRIEELQKGGPVALMNERVREELKKPEWRGKIGQYAGGTEFYKGLETAGITSAALFARAGQIVGAPGADQTMRDLGEIQSTQDLRLGGSTRRALEGGVFNDSIKSAQQSLGQMAPFMVGGMLARAGLGAAGGEAAASELAKQQAGRLGAAGAGMSASAAGAAELETQRKIDAAEQAGDTAKADRLRAGRDLHALLTGITEGAVERLGAGQTQNIFRGGVLKAGKELGKEGVEEVVTGGIQRAVVDPVTLDERPDVFGPMPQELLSGVMAAGPIAGGGALANLNQRGNKDGLQSGQATGTAGTNAQGTGAAPSGGVAGGNPFAGPIQAPPQRDEAGNVIKVGPQPVPTFQDDPYGTLARQPAGGNVLLDYGIPRTAEAQAVLEQQQAAYAQSQATAQGQMNRAGGRMPMIPDNPLGYRDILDFVNDNPLYIPTKGTEAAKSGEYDWTGQYELPKYYRRFLASSEGGMRADQLAQMAHDEGYISQPTPDALMEQINKTVRERTQYRVEFRRQQQAQNDEARRLTNFDQAQNDEARRLTNFDQAQQKASPVESTALPLQTVQVGDEFTLAGENARVSQVEYDEDGNVTLVQIEDGKKFGVLNLDAQARGGILVDEYKPLPRGGGSGPVAPNVEDADPFMPAPPNKNVSAAAARAFALATGQQSELSPTLRRSMFAGAPATPAGGQPGGTSGARGVGKLFSMPEGSTGTGAMQMQNAPGSGDPVTSGAGGKREMVQPQAPEAGALGDVENMSATNVDWALTHLDGRMRQEALGVGPGHYSKPAMSAEWYGYLLGKVQTEEGQMELNSMYAEMNPAAKLMSKPGLPRAEIRQGDVMALTPEQAAWILTNTDGGSRQELLGVAQAHYSNPEIANGWAQHVAAKVRHDPVALQELEAMYQEMVPNAMDSAMISPSVMAGAYAAAKKGSSTDMVPIKRMYQEALKLQPGLTVPKFLEAVHEADNSGAVMLEVYDQPQEVKDAGEFVLKNASGIPAVRMMMTPPEEGDLMMPANLQRPAVEDIKNIVNASISRAEVDPLLKGLNTEEVKEITRSLGYPTQGTKADNIKRILSFVGSRADAIAIRGVNPVNLNAPTIVRSLEQQKAFDEQRRAANERAKELDINIPKAKPRTAEEFARDMASLMAPSLVPPEEGDLMMPANLQRPAVAGPLPSNYSGAASPTLRPATQPWSGRVQSLMGIRKYLLNAVGLPAVGVGRFKRALGIYRIKPQSVRLQAINDIPVLAHEVGHAIHYRVLSGNAAVAATWNGRHDAELMALGAPTSQAGYTPAMVRKEGVAEFTRLWLTDPVQAWAQAPGFATFWQSEIQARNPGMYEALQKSQRMIADYVAMPEAQRGMSQIAFDPAALEIKATMGEWMRTAYASVVDTLEPMLRVVRQTVEMNPQLETQAQDLVMWAENHRGGAASKASADIFQSQTDLTGNVVGPGLQTILKDLQPGENRMFSYYLAVKRAQELERRGMRSGFENAHPPAAEMRAMEARFEATRLKLQTWMKNGKNLLVQAGLLDAASSKAMDDANQDYVPFYRLYEKLNGVSFGPEGTQSGGGFVDLNSGIKRIKGSDRMIVDPLQSVMKNAFMFRKLAEQNVIGQKFFDLVKEVHGHGMWGEEIAPKMQPTTIKHDEVVKKLKEQGIIQDASQLPASADLTLRLFQAMTKPDTKNGEVIIFRNGKRDHWQIKDPMLMQALKYADADAAKLNGIAGWFKAILTVPVKVLRFGATGGPWFALPNIIRDTVQGGVMSTSKGKGATGFVPFWDTLRGGWNILRNGGAFEQWKQAGGEFSGMVSGTKAFTALLEEALPKDPLAQRAIQGLASPAAWKTGLRNALDLVGAFGQLSERATRVGEFMRAKDNGATDMAAANFSKTVSLNFARAGEMSRVLNQFIPFLNATIQGLDQFWQAHANPKTRTATILKAFTFVTVPSLLCWALGKDDEEIQNLPEERKFLFWNINLKPLAAAMGMPEKGFILSIPKPFLLGAVYGTSVEKMLDYATGRDPNGAAKAANNILANTINPFDVMMSIGGIRPIIEARTNQSLFTGRDIVPQSYQALPKEFQYSVLTSETAKTLGKFTGQSPMMIDHLLRGYFATAGKFGTDVIDYGMAKLALTDVPPPPRKGMMELPILNRFAGSPYQANAFVSRFYEASKDMEGKLSVLNKQSENLTTDEQKKWFAANRDELGHYLRTVNGQTGRTGAGEVRAAQATLSELNAAMKTVQASRVLSPDVKRARMMELTQTRNKVAESGFKALFPEQVRIRHW